MRRDAHRGTILSGAGTKSPSGSGRHLRAKAPGEGAASCCSKTSAWVELRRCMIFAGSLPARDDLGGHLREGGGKIVQAVDLDADAGAFGKLAGFAAGRNRF